MQQQSIYAKWWKVGDQPELSSMRIWRNLNLKELEGIWSSWRKQIKSLISGLIRTETCKNGAQKNGDNLGWGVEFPQLLLSVSNVCLPRFTGHCLHWWSCCGSTRLWWSQFNWQLITDSGITIRPEVIESLLTSFFIITAEGMRKQLQTSTCNKIIFKGTLTASWETMLQIKTMKPFSHSS